MQLYISILGWDLCNKSPPSCDPSQYQVSHTVSYILERKLLLRNYDWIWMWEEICDWDYFWYNWYIHDGSNSDYGQYDWFHWETENGDINWFDDFKVDKNHFDHSSGDCAHFPGSVFVLSVLSFLLSSLPAYWRTFLWGFQRIMVSGLLSTRNFQVGVYFSTGYYIKCF